MKRKVEEAIQSCRAIETEVAELLRVQAETEAAIDRLQVTLDRLLVTIDTLQVTHDALELFIEKNIDATREDGDSI